jgi:hypothetical protein
MVAVELFLNALRLLVALLQRKRVAGRDDFDWDRREGRRERVRSGRYTPLQCGTDGRLVAEGIDWSESNTLIPINTHLWSWASSWGVRRSTLRWSCQYSCPPLFRLFSSATSESLSTRTVTSTTLYKNTCTFTVDQDGSLDGLNTSPKITHEMVIIRLDAANSAQRSAFLLLEAHTELRRHLWLHPRQQLLDCLRSLLQFPPRDTRYKPPA